MTKTQKLVDTIARLNPDAGEIGAGMLANIVAMAREIQEDENTPGRYCGQVDVDGESMSFFKNVSF